MTLKYTALEALASALNTELNSLGNGAVSAASAAVINKSSGTRFTSALAQITIATQGAARTAGAYVTLYAIPNAANDGTSFPDVVGECLDNYEIGRFTLDASATGRVIEGEVRLPPSDFKLLMKNGTGQAFAASGNNVKLANFGWDNV